MQEYHDFAVALVQEAGKRLQNAAHTVVSHKADERDIVTSTDLEINAYLIEQIHGAYPEHKIFSEEGNVAGASVSTFEWTLDPIDGSSNFARGIPHFAVCVGLLSDGVPVVGAIYNPITDEVFSFDSRGAFLNGQPIHTSKVETPGEAQSLLVVGHQAPLWDWGAAVYRDFLEHMQKLKVLGSSSLDLCFLAAGRADIVVYGTMTTKDIAPAIGLVRAAGGEVYTLSGVPVELSAQRQTVVATANKQMFENSRTLLHAELLDAK
jgi:myo-inositol-1(or 4)-monophosphatase